MKLSDYDLRRAIQAVEEAMRFDGFDPFLKEHLETIIKALESSLSKPRS